MRLRDRLAGLGSGFVVALVAVLVLAAPALADWSASLVRSQTVTMGTLAAPAGLTAVNGACVAQASWPVDLSWTASSSTFTDGYEIFRSTIASGGPYASLGTVNGRTTTTYIDSTTTFATTYYYVVQAKRNLWRSPNSNVATVTTLKRNCN